MKAGEIGQEVRHLHFMHTANLYGLRAFPRVISEPKDRNILWAIYFVSCFLNINNNNINNKLSEKEQDVGDDRWIIDDDNNGNNEGR